MKHDHDKGCNRKDGKDRKAEGQHEDMVSITSGCPNSTCTPSQLTTKSAMEDTAKKTGGRTWKKEETTNTKTSQAVLP